MTTKLDDMGWPIRPPVASQPKMTAERFAELQEQHRPYKVVGGAILCLACTLPNVPDDVMAPARTFWPCVFARLFEFVNTPAEVER